MNKNSMPFYELGEFELAREYAYLINKDSNIGN